VGKKTAQGPERSQGLVRLPTDPPSLFMGLKQRGGRGNPRREPPVAGFLLGGWRGSTLPKPLHTARFRLTTNVAVYREF